MVRSECEIVRSECEIVRGECESESESLINFYVANNVQKQAGTALGSKPRLD